MYKSNLFEIMSLAKGNLGRALHEVAGFVATEAKVRTPVDTGLLRSNNQGSVEGNFAVITNKTAYAAAVELGTSRQRPQPYLGPALTENASSITGIIAGALRW